MDQSTDRWELLPIPNDNSASFVIRLNALGSLYYFEKFVLQKHRLVEHLHKPICETLERKDSNFLLELPRDHFKALDVDTLIPTPNGFKSMFEIDTGDIVYGVDGREVRVLGVSGVKLSDKVYKITFSTGETIIADAGHLWETDAKKSRENGNVKSWPTIKTTEEISRTVFIRKEHNHRIRVAGAIESNRKVSFPYTLGAWLGDGHTSASRITLHPKDSEIIGHIRQEGFVVTKHKDPLNWGILGFITELRSLGVADNKFIPYSYLRASVECRLSMLQGLMDTDGSISKEGQCTFSGMNPVLVNNCRDLVASLGMKPSTVYSWNAMLNGGVIGVCYGFTFYPTKPVFRLKRKLSRQRELKRTDSRFIVNVESVDARHVKCIMVASEDGLYLVGRGFIPTHNTTCVTEGLPLWWSLPFDERDEAAMRELGYGDEWIAWMKWTHNPGVRVLTISETEENAVRMGIRIDKHFESNSIFREVFQEILPSEKSVWNTVSKSVTHSIFHANGEGTFDYLGVGGALQSRHYERMIEDDIVGKKALKSDIVMEDTIEYHKLLEGAFDGPDHSQIVVGNRWSPFDLNGWIRDNDPDFIIESHSALGGCCDLHPPGSPIFPEEFDTERLERIRRIQGGYLFSHQYLNMPVMEEEVVFNKAWLRYYSPKKDQQSGKLLLDHEPVEGTVVRDVPASWLFRTMIVDPNHAGSEGRAYHAIVIVGLNPDTDMIYLLDVWARSMSYDDLMVNVYKMAEKWKMQEFWIETVAAQRYLKYHIEYRNKIENRQLRVRELKSERSKNAKWTRIDALAPVFEQGKFWVRRDQSAFLDEFFRYTHSTRMPVDVLDCAGYSLQTLEPVRMRELLQKKNERRENFQGQKRGVAGY